MTSLLSYLGQAIGLTPAWGKFWATWAGGQSSSGERVTPDSAMQIAAFWRGIKLGAETQATLPLNVHQNLGDGESELARDNNYDLILRVAPNAELTPTEFWEAIVGAQDVLGNGYARKLRVDDRLVGLELTDQGQTEPYRDQRNGQLRYKGKDQFGRPFDLDSSEIFHLRGFSFGGVKGLSTVEYGVQSLGTAQAANKAAAKIMGSGLSSSGFLQTQQVLEEPDRERLHEILDQYAGSDNAGKMMILEGGMTYNRISLSAADAQLLMQQHFGIEEIGRWLGMPPILLGHVTEGQTMWGTGVEHIISAWLTLGLRSKLTRTERAINKRLIEPKDQMKYFAKYNIDAILRGDSAAQANLFGALAQNGIMTRNEIRKKLDLPPMEGGDELTVQVNMTLLRRLGDQNQEVAKTARASLIAWLSDVESRPPTPVALLPRAA